MQKILILAALLASAFADSHMNVNDSGTKPPCNNSNSNSNSNSVSAAAVTDVIVEVGPGGTLTYAPDDIQVAPGTVVQFNFNPKNHTVTESSFAEPCVPLGANATRPPIKSGFVPVAAEDADLAVFRVLVNDTKPIWLFCGQKNPKPHCQAGMVMVINQNRTDTVKTLQAYKDKAMAVPVPPASGSSSSSASATASASSSSSAASSTGSAVAVTPGAGTPTTPSAGPVLSASATTNGTAVIATYTGGAVPTGSPARFAAAGAGALAMAAAALL